PRSLDVVAISPNGRLLATGGPWNTIRLWPLQIEELVTTACQTVGRNYTYEEWQARFASRSARLTCPEHPIHGSFIAEARMIANAGDYEGAEAQYQLVQSLDPDLAIDPANELAQI